MQHLLMAPQYRVLQELAVNELAQNLPAYDQKKKKHQLQKALQRSIRRLAQGKLSTHTLQRLYPLLRIWARHALKYHGLHSA